MNQQLANETLKELTHLQRNLDTLLGMVDDPDVDGIEVFETFIEKFNNGTDYSETCSKAKGFIHPIATKGFSEKTLKEIEEGTDCLSAALTLLVKSGVLKERDVLDAVSGGGHDKVFDLINEEYKEVMREL